MKWMCIVLNKLEQPRKIQEITNKVVIQSTNLANMSKL
jgi:hypothetical protein